MSALLTPMIQAIGQAPAVGLNPLPPAPAPSTSVSFSQMLSAGVDHVNATALDADNMVRAFTLDDSIPVHQVTYALSQAQLSLEMMVQMRNRLVEGYQQLMNMQL